MTKDQFLNGDLFKLSQHGSKYRLSDEKNSINTAFILSKGEVLDVAFEMHVDFVGRVAVKMSRMVLNKMVNMSVKFEDMILVDIQGEVDKRKAYQEKREREEKEKLEEFRGE